MSTVDGKIVKIIEDENEPSEIIKDKKTGKNIKKKKKNKRKKEEKRKDQKKKK